MPGAVDVLVVGAGQAGLGAAHWLRRRTSLDVLVVDGADRIGTTWRERWDSLTLFTPRRFSSLPGWRFPRGTGPPTKDETASYLERYARRFSLPVRLGARVEALVPHGDGFQAITAAGVVRARQVVLACGPFSGPYIPPAGRELDPPVVQVHSAAYRAPGDLPPGEVFVVGGGNSAAQLAVELSATRPVTVVAPQPMWFLPARVLGVSLYWWIYLTGVLNGPPETPTSRLVRRRGDGIIGRDLQRLVAAGRVRMVHGRVESADGTALVLDDGTRLSASAVLWCTGFRPDLSFLQVPGALDDHGRPVHDQGASPVAGLHWIGLPWQSRLNSGILDGIDRDARTLADRVGRPRQGNTR